MTLEFWALPRGHGLGELHIRAGARGWAIIVFPMQPNLSSIAPRKILAVMSDLMFTVKVLDAAKRVGLGAQFVKTDQDVAAQLGAGPVLVILDLNCGSVNPIEVIRTVKAAGVPVISFVSHVQTGLIEAAQDAGCDLVMARSAFSAGIVGLLEKLTAGQRVGSE